MKHSRIKLFFLCLTFLLGLLSSYSNVSAHSTNLLFSGQVVYVDGVTFSVSEVKIDDDYVSFKLTYNLPNGHDYMLTRPWLEIGDQKFLASGGNLVSQTMQTPQGLYSVSIPEVVSESPGLFAEEVSPNLLTPYNKTEWVYFEGVKGMGQAKMLRLVIPGIQLVLQEGDWCHQELIEAVTEQFASEKPDLKVSCYDQPGLMGYQIENGEELQKSQPDLYDKIQAEIYQLWYQPVDGPWVIEVGLGG